MSDDPRKTIGTLLSAADAAMHRGDLKVAAVYVATAAGVLRDARVALSESERAIRLSEAQLVSLVEARS